MKLLLAVSGGVDSMYLANRAPELYPGARFAVAHCNFSLRGDESDGDEAFVREWCSRNGVECFVRKFDTAGYAASNHVSIEMAARELRYAWFAELCAGYGFDALCTAHNANDNAETLILNLLRGTGSRGLRGIGSCTSANAAAGGGSITILRPLIETSRKEIEEWMRTNGKQWREDSTNRESIAKRNIIRNEVFPIFERINPSHIQTLNADIRRFVQVDNIAEDYYLAAKNDVCDGTGIIIDRLLELRHWQYVLFRLTEDCGFCNETFDKLVESLERFRTCPRGTVTVGGKTFEGTNALLKAAKGKLVKISK